jgi:cyclophilin family peptidyl-prolyl cis-trans isomerase
MIKKILTPLVLILLLVTLACKERYPDLEDGIYAEFVTSKDTMIAKLFFKEAPVTVANFIALAEGVHPLVKDEFKNKRYYDGTTFHRVMDKFMIQGGDPTATGAGDPGYKFEDEFIETLRHDKPGMLSMANSGVATNGSQFFITEVPTPYLDAFDANGNLKNCGGYRVSCHAVFGEIVKGIDVQDAISNVPVAQGSNKPVEDVVIKQLNIIRIGSDAKKFDAAKVFTEELPKIKERVAERKAKIKEEADQKVRIAKENFLKKNEEFKGRREESLTGMAMIFLEEAKDGIIPNASQSVSINCAGYFENGELFWTTWKDVAEKNGKYDKGESYEPFNMPYNQQATLVAGFREAMLKMNVGDKARVFVPYYLGYGDSGRAPLIPAKTNLVFDIAISGIVK